MTSAYPITLTDEQYALLEPLLLPPAPCGRPRSVSLNRVIEAMFYVLITGCPWRLLPHDPRQARSTTTSNSGLKRASGNTFTTL